MNFADQNVTEIIKFDLGNSNLTTLFWLLMTDFENIVEKEKMLDTSIFLFYNNVFLPI